MTERGTSLRNTLHTDVTSLANRGLVDAGRLDQYRGAPGYKVFAADLFLLADVLRGSWNQIASKTPVTLKELDEAEVLADRLLTSIGERAQAPTVPADSALDRQRAFTLLLHAYSEARRAVAFLRWYEGDVETIAPSLYAGRSNGNHRRRGEAPSDDEDTLARDAASVAPTAGARNEAPTTGGPSSITNHAPGAIETGMPGSDPFGGD